jgi:hypothetical protein
MADTQKRIDELAESSEKARKAGRIRQSLSLPEDKRWDAPFSGVSLKSVYASRQAASDKLQNLRDEETEALTQRQKMEKSKEGKAKGGAVKMAEGGVTKFAGRTGIEAAAMEKAFKDEYKKYGPSQGPADDQRVSRAIQDAGSAARDEIKRETRGKAKGGAVKFAKGGSVSARADGCAQRGKTKGRIV